MKEIWKDIEGYEGLYQVSNLGRIKSLAREVSHNQPNGKTSYMRKEIIRKQWLDKDGYSIITLTKDGNRKTFKVHRLVALAFILNDDIITKTQVNHIDEDKTNNKVSNLEWCAPDYNNNYGTRTKRAAKTLSQRVICITTGKVYNSASEVTRLFNISNNSNVSQCCRGLRNYITIDGQKCVFRYLDDNNQPIEPTIEKENLRANKVRCINNNTVYPSVTQASKKLGLNRSYISENCKGQREYVKKGEILYKFEYVSQKNVNTEES